MTLPAKRPARRAEIVADPGLVDRILTEGAKKAHEVSDSVMARVRNAVGL